MRKLNINQIAKYSLVEENADILIKDFKSFLYD